MSGKRTENGTAVRAMPFASGFRVASPFGNRVDPITGEPGSWHGGVDLVDLDGDRSVRAAAGGTVLRSRIVTDPADRTSEWGHYLSVAGDDGFTVYYCHLESRSAAAGERVEAGQVIGVEGSTGRSTGIHLHFEVRDGAGNQTDPCAYLGIPNEVGYIRTPEGTGDRDNGIRTACLAEAHDWSREAVGWAVDRGILRGRGNGDPALGEPVTREEVCVMLMRAAEKT